MSTGEPAAASGIRPAKVGERDRGGEGRAPSAPQAAHLHGCASRRRRVLPRPRRKSGPAAEPRPGGPARARAWRGVVYGPCVAGGHDATPEGAAAGGECGMGWGRWHAATHAIYGSGEREMATSAAEAPQLPCPIGCGRRYGLPAASADHCGLDQKRPAAVRAADAMPILDGRSSGGVYNTPPLIGCPKRKSGISGV